MTKYRSVSYPAFELQEFGTQREPDREGRPGGWAGKAIWRGKGGTTATTFCGCPHFTEDGALACIERRHRVRAPRPGWLPPAGKSVCTYHGIVDLEHACRAPGETADQFTARMFGEMRDV